VQEEYRAQLRKQESVLRGETREIFWM